MSPSRDELRRAETFLRRYDRAVRLRFSQERSDTILLERKVYRGRIGKMHYSGLPFDPDGGYRAEWGHVAVASMPAAHFDARGLLESLKEADTWKREQPWWREAEAHDEYERDTKHRRRQDTTKAVAGQMWDRYAWKTKSRIVVPAQIV